jgi:hypothetical protein
MINSLHWNNVMRVTNRKADGNARQTDRPCILKLWALSLLVASASGCATLGQHPGPTAVTPDTVEALAASVPAVDSLHNLHFTPDATITTMAGQITGALAVQAFASGTLEGRSYETVALTRERVFACDGRVVVVEGTYAATVSTGATETGAFALRANVARDGTRDVTLLHMGKDLPRVAVMAHGCQQLGTQRFGTHAVGITLVATGWVISTAGREVDTDMNMAGWACDTMCNGMHKDRGGYLAQVYARLWGRTGIQLAGGQLWSTKSQGYRTSMTSPGNGFVWLHSNADIVALTGFWDWRNVRIAAGPALVRSEWSWYAQMPQADALGFTDAHAVHYSPGFLASVNLALPISNRIALELVGMTEVTHSYAPPSVLEFQPQPVNLSSMALAAGVEIRP